MPNDQAPPVEGDETTIAEADIAAAPPLLELEIFRAGDYGSNGVYGVDDLEAIAAAYDPAAHEAPLTLDHAQAGPAHGWVERLERRGDALWAVVRGASPYVRNAIALGYYKKPSIELYPKSADRKTATLRAVSMLGAGVPRVKGMAPPAAAESDDAIPFFPEAEAQAVGNRSVRPASGAAASPSAAKPPRDAPAAFDPAPLIERLRRAGKYLPAWDRLGLPEFLRWLGAQASPAPAQGGAIAFAEDGRTPVAWFAEFLERMEGVALGAVAEPPRDERPRGAQEMAAPFGLPLERGRARLAPESVALHEAAARLIHAEPALGYAEALRRAAREGAAESRRRRTM